MEVVTTDIEGGAAESSLYTVTIGVPYPAFVAGDVIGGYNGELGFVGS